MFYSAMAIIAAVGVVEIVRPAHTHATPSCPIIHYVFNPDHAPDGALADVQGAMARVAEASGVGFQFDGVSDERPTLAHSGAEVLVAWVDPSVYAASDSG